MNPKIRDDVASLLPAPDLTAMEEPLNTHKKNIFKVGRKVPEEKVSLKVQFSPRKEYLKKLRRSKTSIKYP